MSLLYIIRSIYKKFLRIFEILLGSDVTIPSLSLIMVLIDRCLTKLQARNKQQQTNNYSEASAAVFTMSTAQLMVSLSPHNNLNSLVSDIPSKYE